MRLTDYFITKTDRFKKHPEPHGKEWTNLNRESPEMEVCEFLYSITRLLRPKWVLETGGGTGNSGAYIGQALKENKQGYLVSLEPFPQSYEKAAALWAELGLSGRIYLRTKTSFDYDPGKLRFQMLFLDSEPTCRFTEVRKFYPYLDPGGLVLIHDLKRKHHAEWEDFRPHIGRELRNYSLQVINLECPRGLTILQKWHPDSTFNNYLRHKK